jgi:hypothetical protein
MIVEDKSVFHIHCYRYNLWKALEWHNQFPNAYFGLTAEICHPKCNPELLEVFFKFFPLLYF